MTKNNHFNKTKVFAYIRVSRINQVDGASLFQQKQSIQEYAKKNNLIISKWFEETKTAAKTGRPFFDEMMRRLRNGFASGVIIHKIDRSARNLHDWALVGDLIDLGIQVHFAHESLDMTERGGRLSADIQAVMASDYVRNLRQETIKGLQGRLKQGIFPFAAPIGYVDTGKGNLKTIHLVNGKLIEKLFELYVYGNYNLKSLTKEMYEHGLRNRKGNKVDKNGISRILNNPFYTGLMSIKGNLYKGKHKPIIPKKLFKQAQLVLKNRVKHKGYKHDYTYRKHIKCQHCNYYLIGENQKGIIYYRCHTKGCLTKSIREDLVEHCFRNVIKQVSLTDKENDLLLELSEKQDKNSNKMLSSLLQKNKMELTKLKIKEERLLDAYLENTIEKDAYEKKKNSLVEQVFEKEQSVKELLLKKHKVFDEINGFLELCKSFLNTYDSAIKYEKRIIVKTITSNFMAAGRNVVISTCSPFTELKNRSLLTKCARLRGTSRKLGNEIIYTDKNTSPILFKPLNKDEIAKFYQILLEKREYFPEIPKLYLNEKSNTLPNLKNAQINNAISTNNTSSE
ncbi:recombinase family protein [Maribacter sp.]|nr:recombinase family protein [Maribacter sp.]